MILYRPAANNQIRFITQYRRQKFRNVSTAILIISISIYNYIGSQGKGFFYSGRKRDT